VAAVGQEENQVDIFYRTEITMSRFLTEEYI
jgi:hypothetical protein